MAIWKYKKEGKKSRRERKVAVTEIERERETVIVISTI